MKKQLIKEVQQFKKIAGLINENWHPDDPASVDLDDREEDPDDYDDISEGDYSEDPSSDMDDENQSGDTDAMDINETEDVKKRQLYARYVNGFINQNQDDLGQIYDEQGYLAALKMVRDKVAGILHRAGEYEYPTAQSGIGDSFPLVDAIHRIFKQIGFKKAHKGV